MFLSIVMCFSIILAPNVTAAIGTLIPLSCPEYPTIEEDNSDNRFKYFKFISLKGAGVS